MNFSNRSILGSIWERHGGILPGEQNLCFWQGPDNGLRSRRGRCSGSTSPAPSTPACACPMSEVFNFNHNLLHISWIFSQSFDHQFDFQNFANLVFCLMPHLSVIRIMQDVIEGLWLHVTEHRLQADHSKKCHVKTTLHGKPRAQFFSSNASKWPSSKIFLWCYFSRCQQSLKTSFQQFWMK